MHMTSQKGAPACWGSKEALSRAPSPGMQPAGQPLHAISPGRPGPAHWLRGWECQRSSSTTRAHSATSLDPQHGIVVMETWRQCIRSIAHVFFNYSVAEWRFADCTLLHHLKWLFLSDWLLQDSSQTGLRNSISNVDKLHVVWKWRWMCILMGSFT